MKTLPELFQKNEEWRRDIELDNPGFFKTLENQQSPRFLWIGCADSRVPANQIVGLMPGELFVHRNVANLVNHTDLNLLSVLQFAVDVLKVEHIMVVGHYGCGGVRAAMEDQPHGLIDNWLRHVQDAQSKHYKELQTIADEHELVDKVCEINVIEQALSVCQTTVIQDAWDRGQDVTVHSCIYGLKDGLLKNLGMSVGRTDQIYPLYKQAIQDLFDSQSA